MKNVLLVDDDFVFNFLNTRVLQNLDFINNIDTAENGKQAIELLKRYSQSAKPFPDFILLDLNMPVMNGFEFLEAFANMDLPKKSAVKIIVLSSSEDPSDIQRAKSLGIAQYLTKPLEEERLLEAIRNLAD